MSWTSWRKTKNGMRFESFEKRPMSAAKAELFALEKTGRFVFHGAPRLDIAELEPRQARQFVPETGRHVPDGPPAVAASPYAEIAIFRAVVQTGHSGFSSYESDDDVALRTRLGFRATQAALDEASGAEGYVYVLPREVFEPLPGASRSSMDWRCPGRVKPVAVIRVTAEDLPEDIRIMEK